MSKTILQPFHSVGLVTLKHLYMYYDKWLSTYVYIEMVVADY